MDTAVQQPPDTVTVLLAGVVGPGRPDGSGPEAMTTAMAGLGAILSEAVAVHDGVLAGRRDGNLFVAAFRAVSAAVACALDLQRAPTAPAGLRVLPLPDRGVCPSLNHG